MSAVIGTDLFVKRQIKVHGKVYKNCLLRFWSSLGKVFVFSSLKEGRKRERERV